MTFEQQKKQSISVHQRMMQYKDHLEFMKYCEKIEKACSELVERRHVIMMAMATGDDLSNRLSISK